MPLLIKDRVAGYFQYFHVEIERKIYRTLGYGPISDASCSCGFY